jgi:hypothetical protein
MGKKKLRGERIKIRMEELLGGGYVDLAVLYSQVVAVQHQRRNSKGSQA